MAEYIKREDVNQVLQGIANGLLVGETEALKAKDMKSLLKIKAAKEILKTLDNDLCFIPNADVQPVDTKEILTHLDSLMICVTNAYNTSHGLLQTDMMFIEKQAEIIKELLVEQGTKNG